MKAFKLTFLVVDLEDQGLESILVEFENMKHGVSPSLLDSEEFEIGEWEDDHPLNDPNRMKKHLECLRRAKKSLNIPKGSQIGNWLVLGYVFNKDRYGNSWKCRCICGKEKMLSYTELMGKHKSCGCLQYKKPIKIGHKRFSFKEASLLTGISVASLQERKYRGLSDEEIIAKSNKKTLTLTFNGQTKTMKEWSKEIGLGYSCLYDRYMNGWTVEEILTTPKNPPRRSRKQKKEEKDGSCCSE